MCRRPILKACVCVQCVCVCTQHYDQSRVPAATKRWLTQLGMVVDRQVDPLYVPVAHRHIHSVGGTAGGQNNSTVIR